ncbi:hypothetical protein [Ramlibacter sp. AN1133]|uniref:hypothetical protein n=1 Tax=Ramlibacter sp. AN1133 TaxID=3133429 RepID=UPI0030BFFF4D
MMTRLTSDQRIHLLALGLRELYPYVLKYDGPGERWPRLCIAQTLQAAGLALQHNDPEPPAPGAPALAGWLRQEMGETSFRAHGEEAPGWEPVFKGTPDQLELLREFARLAHTCQALKTALVQSDDYLRSIRSEELDGSEPALGEMLHENLVLLHKRGLGADPGEPQDDTRRSSEGVRA